MTKEELCGRFDVKIFTDNEISPWGGLTLLFKMLEKCGLRDALAECPLPQQGSNRGYSPEQLIPNRSLEF